MNYLSISIHCPNTEEQELLIAQLAEIDFEGFEQTATELNAFIPVQAFNKELLEELLKGMDYRLEELQDRNWNEEWEQSFQPIVIEDFCAIRAHFHEPVSHVKHEIVITPKMSFGTGHHPTTRLMIVLMSETDFREKTVLDFGTGTGVLAILAEKLGAQKVLATDNDEWAINNAMENIERNGMMTIETTMAPGYMEEPEQYDIILANINRHVILDHFNKMYSSLKKNGTCLISGLLESDGELITAGAENAGFTVKYTIGLDNWIALELVKNTPSGTQ